MTMEPPQVWQPESLLGQVLDKYEVRGILGEGGMGVVYHAQHTALRRTVAIKVLRPHFAQRSDVIGRLFEEARTVNEIRHSNIVDIIDFVDHSDQTPPMVYTVMELLEGENLGQRIERVGALNVPEAIGVALQVVDALTAVHAVSIIHRDLKPENIFLSDGPDGEEVKLLDFGIAKAFGDREGPNLTTPGQFVGTPEFMAPEQVLDRNLDARTDVYTVGLLLYTMLTGAIPFASSRYGEVMVARLNDPPPSLEGRAISKELAAVVMRCLEREPDQRFQTAEELKAVLAACQVQATRKRPARWPLVAGAIVALLAAATAAWWLFLRDPPPEPIAVGSTVDSTARSTVDAAPVAPASATTVAAAPASAPAAAPDAGRPDTTTATARVKTNRRRRRHRRPRRVRRRRRKSHKSHKQKKNVVHGIMDPFSR